MGRLAKLTKEQVEEVRNSEASLKALSRKFGVSVPTISAVRNSKGAYRDKEEVYTSNDRGTAETVQQDVLQGLFK